MASFRKRNGKWQVQVRRERQCIARSFTLKADAESWARRMESDMEAGRFVPVRAAGTLGDLLQRYLAEVTPGKRSAEKETYRVRRLLRHSLAELRLDGMLPTPFAEFRDERLSQAGAQAVRHDLNLLGHVISVAQTEWNLPIAANPLSLIRKPRQPASRQRRLSGEEWQRFFVAVSECRNPQFRALVLFAVETAMRRGELLAMGWEHVDWERSLVRVPVSKNGHGRIVPLTNAGQAILRRLEQRSGGAVFRLSVPAVRSSWDRLVRRASVADYHFHDLRHEAVSRLFERGLSVPEVALVSGHRDVRQLFRYTHLRAEDVARKLARAEAA